MTKEILEGEDEAKIEIILKNNKNLDWPQFKTKLTYDFNSNFIQDDIILAPQKYNEIKKYDIVLNELSQYPALEYKVYLLFEVNGDIYGEKIEINLIIKENKKDELERADQFRKTFNLSKEEFPDGKIVQLLKKYNNSFEDAFMSLIS